MDQMFVCLVIVLSCVNTVVLKDICEPLKTNNNMIDIILEEMPKSIEPNVEHNWLLVIDQHFWTMEYNPSTEGFVITKDGSLGKNWTVYYSHFIYMKNVSNAEPKYYGATYMEEQKVINTTEMISHNRSQIPNVWFKSDFKPTVIFSPLIDDRKVYNEFVLALQQKDIDNGFDIEVRVYVYENDGLIDKTEEMSDKIPKFVKQLDPTLHVNQIIPLHTLGSYLVIFDEETDSLYCLTKSSEDNKCSDRLKILVNCSHYIPTTTVKPTTTSTTTTAKPPKRTTTKTITKPPTTTTTTTTTTKTMKPKPKRKAEYMILIVVLCIGIISLFVVLMISWFIYFCVKYTKKTRTPSRSR